MGAYFENEIKYLKNGIDLIQQAIDKLQREYDAYCANTAKLSSERSKECMAHATNDDKSKSLAKPVCSSGSDTKINKTSFARRRA